MNNIEIKVVNNPESLESLSDFNPETTLIIGGETELYKSCGFYYSFETSADVDSIVEEYTNKINAVGVIECYELHRAMYVEENLRADKEVCSTNSVLHTLLDAIELHDYEEVGRILQYNLEILKKNADKLQKIYSISSSDDTWELKYVRCKQQLKDLTLKYNELASEVSSLRKYSDNVRDLEMARIQIKEDTEKISDLTAKIAELESELSNTHTDKEYNDLKEKLDLAEDTITQLNTKINSREQSTNYFSSNGSDSVKDAIISELKATISELNSKQQSNINPDDNLPVIDANLGLRVKKLFNIKEIKRSVYLPALIECIAARSRTAKAKISGVRFIVIVYDILNDFNKNMYANFGFALNSGDLSNTVYNVVVTDILSRTFLVNEVNIASYDYVVIVDRLGYNKMVVDRFDAKTYYLVDSLQDITDYNLKPSDCICYFDSNGESAYDIIPSETYNAGDYKTRVSMFTKNKGILGKSMLELFPE